MTRFYSVNVANTESLEVASKATSVSAMLGRITKEINARIASDVEANTAPQNDKEYDPMRSCSDSKALAAFCADFKVNPRVLFNSTYLNDADLEKFGVNPIAKTRNLKALAKLTALADLIMHGRMNREAVLHTWIACALASSKFGKLPRDVVESFINSRDMSSVNGELSALVDEYRAKHMSRGCGTQTSQITLLLGLLGVLTIERDGRSKSYRVNRDHPVTQAIAARYGFDLQAA